jgi:hypothetical protein
LKSTWWKPPTKTTLEEQITKCLETLCHADEFDVDYQIAPFRNLVQQPNVVSLYLTAFVIEKLINHKSVVDIFGSDADIYLCIHKQVAKLLSLIAMGPSFPSATGQRSL